MTINTLTKDLRTAVSQITTPGTPGRAAYSSYEDVTVCGFQAVGARYGWVTPDATHDNPNPQPQYVMLTNPPPGSPLVYKCTTSKQLVQHAAVESTPSQTTTVTQDDYNLGWNAGARSIATLPGDGYVEFTVASAVGVAAGLNGSNQGTGYAEMEHAIFLSDGKARVYESGVSKYLIGDFAAGDEFKIRRSNGVVTYYQNGALVYTSEVASSGTVFLDAAMYSAGDEITDPAVVGGMGGAALTLPALGLYGGEGAGAQAALTLPALTLTSYFFQGAALSLPALTLLGTDRRYGEARLTLPAFTLYSEGGYALPPYSLANLMLPPLQLAGYMLTGEVGGAALSLPALLALGSDRIYGAADLALPGLELYSSSYEGPLVGSLVQQAHAAPSFTTSLRMAVVMTSSGKVAATLVYAAVMSADMTSDLEAADTAAAQAVLSALMQSDLAVRASERVVADDDYQVWVVDWEDLSSVVYEQYAFNSFAKIGDQYFGAKADGVYLLEGATDAGQAIRSKVHFGRHDFGTRAQKQMPYVYAGISGSGDMVLRVQVDKGAVYTYTARAMAQDQKVQRFDLGMGLRGSYYEFELCNVNGADFDLDSIEFHPVMLSRKI